MLNVDPEKLALKVTPVDEFSEKSSSNAGDEVQDDLNVPVLSALSLTMVYRISIPLINDALIVLIVPADDLLFSMLALSPSSVTNCPSL